MSQKSTEKERSSITEDLIGLCRFCLNMIYKGDDCDWKHQETCRLRNKEKDDD